MIRQLQKSKRIRDIRSAFSHTLRNLLLRQSKCADHLMQSLCFFNGIQILSLHIFYNCDKHVLLVTQFPEQAWYFRQSGFHGRTPSSFTGYDFIAFLFLSYDNRLYYTVFADGICQFFYFFFRECLSWLVHIGHDFVDTDIVHSVFCRNIRYALLIFFLFFRSSDRHIRKQCIQSSA